MPPLCLCLGSGFSQTCVTDMCNAIFSPYYLLPGAGVDVDITADSLENLPEVEGQPGLR